MEKKKKIMTEGKQDLYWEYVVFLFQSLYSSLQISHLIAKYQKKTLIRVVALTSVNTLS